MTYRQRKARLAAKPTTATLTASAVPVTITASDGGENSVPTFSAIAYSGSIVSKSTASPRLDADYVIDLAGMTKGRSVKVNLDHKTTQRVGHLTDFANDGKQVTVAGALSAATPHRDEVANSAAAGFDWEVSIEAELGAPKRLEKGKTATVNGTTVTGPLWIFGKSKLTALGFVSNGADEGNHVTIAATAAGSEPMNEVEKLAAKLGIDLDNASDAVKVQLQELVDARTATLEGGGKAKSFREIADEERQEFARKESIAKLGHEAIRENPLYIDQIEKAVADAQESKLSVRDFELDLLRSIRTRPGTFNSRMSTSGADPRIIECALAMASGLPAIEKHYNEQTLDAVDRTGLRNFSLQRLLLQVAHANGYHCGVGEKITAGNVKSVLEHCFPPATARLSGFSTVSLPNILGAVANKQILAGYMESDMTWKEIAQVKPVSNFYTQNHYRMLDNLEYEEVGSGGEIRHGTLGEETYTSQAKTYAKMLGITRTQMINDDLGAFDDIRERLGRGGAKKFSTVFWTAFMNNSSFYTTALTNYIEGATTNLGTDGVGLGLMVKAFRQMTTPSADGSKRVGQDLNPTKILVPPELEQIADTVYKNSNLGQVANSSANIYANKYRPVVQWRLSNSSYTGYSTTAWYMFGDEVKPMLVTFLNGNQTPTIQSTDADFNVLGIQFRAFHDWGCDKSEYLAGIKSKGAA